jgi:hypothetical protein
MDNNDFDTCLLESAEKIDRALGPKRIALLKQSYELFKESGHPDAIIQQMMGITSHEMRLIKQ